MGISTLRPAIGIDVGGTGIKGAGIDPTSGELLTRRHKELTPAGGAPEPIATVVARMVAAVRSDLVADGRLEHAEVPAVGITLPGVVQEGVMRTAANIDEHWIGVHAADFLAEAVGAPVVVVNDADAAGIAEADFGAAKDATGLTLVLTFGTGIGSALIYRGELVPNFELGHVDIGEQRNYEKFASPKNIAGEGITLEEWASRVSRYLTHLELILTPDLFVIGGSISKSSDEFLPFAGVRAPTLPAHFRNNAGIVGAASLAARS